MAVKGPRMCALGDLDTIMSQYRDVFICLCHSKSPAGLLGRAGGFEARAHRGGYVFWWIFFPELLNMLLSSSKGLNSCGEMTGSEEGEDEKFSATF